MHDLLNWDRYIPVRGPQLGIILLTLVKVKVTRFELEHAKIIKVLLCPCVNCYHNEGNHYLLHLGIHMCRGYIYYTIMFGQYQNYISCCHSYQLPFLEMQKTPNKEYLRGVYIGCMINAREGDVEGEGVWEGW